MVSKKKEAKRAAEAVAGEQDATKTAEPPAVKGTLTDFFRVFKYANGFDWFLLAACALTSIGAGAALPVMFIIFGRIVNDYSGYSATNGGSMTQSAFYSSNNQNVLYIVYIFIGKFVLSYISLYAVRISGLRISASLRLAYLEALFKQPLSSIDKLSPGKVSHRITSSTNTIQLGISQHLALLVQSLSFVISFYIVAFVQDAILTLVASAALPMTLIIMGVVVNPLIKNEKNAESAREQASGLAHEIFSSIRVVAAFGAEAALSKRHNDLVAEATKIGRKAVPYIALYMSPTLFTTYATSAITFWFGVRQTARGNIDNVGTVVVVYFCVMTATTSLSRVAAPMLAIGNAASAAAELLNTIHEDVPNTSGIKEPEVSAHEDVTFEDVHFSYPSRPDVKILQGMSAKMEAGKVTAIVGPSGSGKSTIVGLVERWYNLQAQVATPDAQNSEKEDSSEGKRHDSDNEKDKEKEKEKEKEAEVSKSIASGAIKIGGRNLEELDLNWLRSQIGFVQQEPFLFNDTIYKNVLFGLCGTAAFKADETTQRKLVEDACRQAHAHDFIVATPDGYDSMVGESGLKLSGGQRQRIAIARSIIKNPPILILDEATSALDVHSEHVVQKALDQVSQNRTTIVIAHRLSTIKKADKIIVLRSGEAIEEGTHESLVAMENGFYHSLVTAQELLLGDDAREEETDIMGPIDKLHPTLSRKRTEPENASEAKKATAPEEKYKNVDIFRSFGRLIWEQKHRWYLYTLAMTSSAITGATYPLMSWIFAKLIQVFDFAFTDRARMVERGNFWSLIFFIMSLVVLATYAILAGAAVTLSIDIAAHYKQEYFGNLVQKPITFFDAEGNSPGTLTSRIATDPQQMQQMMGAEMAVVLVSITNIIGSIIISFVFGWKLALVGCLAVVPIILFAGAMRVKLEIDFEKMNSEVFASSSQFATEAAGAFRTVTSLTMEGTITEKYSVLLTNHATSALKKAIWGTLVFATSDSIDIACNALVFWYGGRLISTGEYNIVQFFVVYMAAVQSTQAAAMWFAFAPSMANATGASNRIISSREVHRPDTTATGLLPQSDQGASITFQNVCFTYANRTDPVLKGLDLTIQAGQFAALVGASGCGKSTIISLIERFYTLDSGAITCDGIEIASLSMSSYRSQLALVAQEPTLYEGTIRENVALSVTADEVTDESIAAACREAHIHDFVASLPDGYNTRLGPRGVSLSGGQKQRIALARALLRQPRLLLLDEATSSLDSESEKMVQEAIERAAGGGKRTILAVAHRLATVQNADVIFVLGPGGKVVESGSHAELVRKRGVYFQMCQAQALDK